MIKINHEPFYDDMISYDYGNLIKIQQVMSLITITQTMS